MIASALCRRACWHSRCVRGSLLPPLSLPSRRFVSTLPNLDLFRALKGHHAATPAVIHSGSGQTYSYGSLLGDVTRTKDLILQTRLNRPSVVRGQPIAFLADNGYDYVVFLLAALACDAVALPLNPSFPDSELKYILDNSQAGLFLATQAYAQKADALVKMQPEGDPVLHLQEQITVGGKHLDDLELSQANDPKGGMMLYTSGTTSRPKGVMIPQSALAAQATSLINAWHYSPADRLLHLLPLHHIHGVVNALLTPLFAGSSIEFLFPFTGPAVWRRLSAPFRAPREDDFPSREPITFFTGVPTHYTTLMADLPSQPPEIQSAGKTAITSAHLRLAISGSAALPEPTKRSWNELSKGNDLLERYGMTEVGMAISGGLAPQDRVAGAVGWPLPGVEVRLVDVDSGEVIREAPEDSSGEYLGEIQLRGPTVFDHYWRNRRATEATFTADPDGGGPWFCTGDVAVRLLVPGAGVGANTESRTRVKSQDWCRGPLYFIRGRLSVDIIKFAGEKVSALEVERELLSLPGIAEAAVVALPSETFGQLPAAVIVLTPEEAKAKSEATADSSSVHDSRRHRVGFLSIRNALQGRLAKYKVPKRVRIIEGRIPRNAMGKVNKKELAKTVFGC